MIKALAPVLFIYLLAHTSFALAAAPIALPLQIIRSVSTPSVAASWQSTQDSRIAPLVMADLKSLGWTWHRIRFHRELNGPIANWQLSPRDGLQASFVLDEQKRGHDRQVRWCVIATQLKTPQCAALWVPAGREQEAAHQIAEASHQFLFGGEYGLRRQLATVVALPPDEQSAAEPARQMVKPLEPKHASTRYWIVITDSQGQQPRVVFQSLQAPTDLHWTADGRRLGFFYPATSTTKSPIEQADWYQLDLATGRLQVLATHLLHGFVKPAEQSVQTVISTPASATNATGISASRTQWVQIQSDGKFNYLDAPVSIESKWYCTPIATEQATQPLTVQCHTSGHGSSTRIRQQVRVKSEQGQILEVAWSPIF